MQCNHIQYSAMSIYIVVMYILSNYNNESILKIQPALLLLKAFKSFSVQPLLSYLRPHFMPLALPLSLNSSPLAFLWRCKQTKILPTCSSLYVEPRLQALYLAGSPSTLSQPKLNLVKAFSDISQRLRNLQLVTSFIGFIALTLICNYLENVFVYFVSVPFC